jgi:heat shock protein HslJ
MILRTLALALALPVPASLAQGSDPLAGSEWRPVEIAGTPTPEDIEVFLQFRAEGAVAGSGGCNRFTGSYTIEDASLAFSPLAATMMMCPEPQMLVERRLLDALAAVRGFARDRVDLVLSDADGAPLVVLIQSDAD